MIRDSNQLSEIKIKLNCTSLEISPSFLTQGLLIQVSISVLHFLVVFKDIMQNRWQSRP